MTKKMRGRVAPDSVYTAIFSLFLPCLGFARYVFQQAVTTGTLGNNTPMFQVKKEFATEKSTQNPLCSLCPRQLLLRCSTSCDPHGCGECQSDVGTSQAIRAVVCGEKIRMVFFSCDLLVSRHSRILLAGILGKYREIPDRSSIKAF